MARGDPSDPTGSRAGGGRHPRWTGPADLTLPSGSTIGQRPPQAPPGGTRDPHRRHEPAGRARPCPHPADRGRGGPQRGGGDHVARRGRGVARGPPVLDPGAHRARGQRGRRRAPASPCSRSSPTPMARRVGRPWPTPRRRASPPSTPATRRRRPCSATVPGIHAGMLGPVGEAQPVEGGFTVTGPLPVRQRQRSRRLAGRRGMEMVDGEPAVSELGPAGDAGVLPAS